MKLDDPRYEHQFNVLVEAPPWGDADFYGRWLLAAARAEALWKIAMRDELFDQTVQLSLIHI